MSDLISSYKAVLGTALASLHMVQTGSGMFLWNLWVFKSLWAKTSHFITWQQIYNYTPYLLSVERAKDSLSVGKAFLLTFAFHPWLLSWACFLFIIFVPLKRAPILAPSCLSRIFLPPSVWESWWQLHLFPSPQCTWKGWNREVPQPGQWNQWQDPSEKCLSQCTDVLGCLVPAKLLGQSLLALCSAAMDHIHFWVFPLQTLPSHCIVGILAILEGCANRLLHSFQAICSPSFGTSNDRKNSLLLFSLLSQFLPNTHSIPGCFFA